MDDSENCTLILSKDEAFTLRAILDRVGGNPYNSPRKHANAIARALEAVGVDYDAVESVRDLLPSSQGVSFKDYPKPFVPGYFRCVNARQTGTAAWCFTQPTPPEVWERVRVVDANATVIPPLLPNLLGPIF